MGEPHVATLTIELKKTKDGRPSLACVRPDGTRTWARVHPCSVQQPRSGCTAHDEGREHDAVRRLSDAQMTAHGATRDVDDRHARLATQ